MAVQNLLYRRHLKYPARRLRKEMTEAEKMLWQRLRHKQILGVQFFRQRPIGNYIVDFFAPKARFVVEVDGSRHTLPSMFIKDRIRDEYLKKRGYL